MNKKIKLTLTCLLSISCLSVFTPVNVSLLTAKAYAETSTYSLADKGEFKSLNVQSTDGQDIELCDDYGGEEKNLTDDEDYYVLVNGKSDGVKIFGEVEGTGYISRVFESDRKYATPHDMGENILLQKGQTTLYVRTYTSKDALERAVDDEDVTNCFKTYEIKINKSPEDGADDVYLETLTLDSGKVPIKFDRDTLSYDISVDESQGDVEIKVRPKNEDYTIKINGFKVDEDNKYKKDLHLKSGVNVIKVILTDLNYRIRTYTLNITRGNSISNEKVFNDKTTIQTNSSNSDIKINQWVQVNGKWQYNDAMGDNIKNSWYYDKIYGNTYYLKQDGTMATNWLELNGNWYYLGQDGGMKTNWQNVNGKWYYLQSNGVMAKNTKIGRYKIGNDGAWVK